MKTIKIAISRCLLGDKVRYDGRGKHDSVIMTLLEKEIEFHIVCPEVECGMSIPREPMRLEGTLLSSELVTHHSRNNLTSQLKTWGKTKLIQLDSENISGYIFKTKSPTCGLSSVPIYAENGDIVADGSGIFAEMVMETFPELPVIDNEQFQNSVLREDFLRKVHNFSKK